MLNNSMIKRLARCLIFLFVFFSYFPAAFAEEETYSLAVIQGEGDRAVDAKFMADLETNLSQIPHLILFERTLIRDILAEQRINAAGFAAEKRNVIHLGRLLSADFLLFVNRVPNDEMLVYSLSIIESKTGIALRSWMTQNEIWGDDIQIIRDAVRLWNSHRQNAGLRYVGILQFKNEDLGAALDGTSQLLEALLTEDLVRSPDILVLDREHLQYLLAEQNLSGQELQLKASAVVIEGGIKFTADQAGINVNLIVRHLNSADVEKNISFKIPLTDRNTETIRARLLTEILEYLNLGTTANEIGSPKKESDLFLRQVALNIAAGEFEKAIRNSEVALALNPSQETRYWAARAWYLMGYSMRRDQALSKVGSFQRINSGQRFSIFSNTVIDSERLERMLSAYLRAYTLFEEISRMHAAHPSGLLIPDPLEGLNILEVGRENPPLKLTIDNQHNRIQRYLPLLIDVSFHFLNLQRDYYANHYADSADVQKAYWDTWLRQKDFIVDYYGYISPNKNEAIGSAFEAYVRFLPRNLEPAMKGLARLIELKPAEVLSDEEIRIYETLGQHEDPYVRLLGEKQLVRIHALESSQNIFKNFSDNFSAKENTWTMKDHGFIPNLLRTSIHRLAVSDRRTLLDYGRPVYQVLLKKENIRLLIAWSVRDVFWPYVNALVLEKRNEDAQVVIRLAMFSLNAGFDKLSPEEKKDARILGGQLEMKATQLKGVNALSPALKKRSPSIDKPSYLRLRPEIEAPRPDGPINLEAFPTKEYKTPHGLITQTASASSTVFSDVGGGNVFSREMTRTIDAEGNEQYTSYHVDAANEKEIEKIRALNAWDAFAIQRTRTRLTGTMNNDRYRMGTGAIVDFDHWLDGRYIYIVQVKKQGNEYVVHGFEHDLFEEGTNRELGSVTVKVAEGQNFGLTAITGDEENFYVGTSGGLLIFKRGAGKAVASADIQTMPGVGDPYVPAKVSQESVRGNVRLINESNGFPDDRILSLVAYQGKVYAGIGPIKETSGGLSGDCGLIAYDPNTAKYALLASSRSLEKHNPLEGGAVYQISAILADKSTGALWLAINGNKELNGIWRYNLSTRQFKQMVHEDLAIQSMQWAGNKILYIMYGSGFTQYDLKTNEKTWLLGYIVSAYSGPSRPVAPKGLEGDPLYGYSKTRLWPYTMMGDDLFTLGWDRTNVILHNGSADTSEKSMLDANANTVSSKQFLAGNEYGLWVATDYGELYRITPINEDGYEK